MNTISRKHHQGCLGLYTLFVGSPGHLAGHYVKQDAGTDELLDCSIRALIIFLRGEVDTSTQGKENVMRVKIFSFPQLSLHLTQKMCFPSLSETVTSSTAGRMHCIVD